MKNRLLTALSRTLAVAGAVVLAACAQTAPPATVPHLDAHADPRRYDDAWFAAARLGRIDILQSLVDAHYPVDATTREGYTAVILAAYRDQPATLDYLLRIGADPCVGDRHGNTALMGALFKGETAIAKRLVDANCPIDQTNHAGETALSFAALFGRLDMLPVLVAHGANPNHVDALGRTALQNAILQGNDAAVAALEKVGATPNADVTLRSRP
ncbi:ankyrin repeat domain-containing protein [Burkholderia latens]|uniref:Ankyrin repeat domain-containing protein n=1 Tax=Burkholderia latens TaxID=488446 RepID=A0A6H9SI69_9BURK|nr:ankyrin repeat domain-containing protein [Burkholderia latens]KAB0633299.1 ankyrin repeat domain-containing protein [Burkholderia latens]VWC26687.1 putative ankyrin-like protein [Burkholderia latens]